MQAVYGTGSWGTTLAIVLARQQEPVTLLARTADEEARLNLAGQNERFLPGVPFPPSLTVTADLAVLNDCRTMVLAVPSETVLPALDHLAGSLPAAATIVSAGKGLVRVDGSAPRRLTQVVGARLPNAVCALSGPNLAREIARGLPATTVAACQDRAQAEAVQRLFTGSSFRVYTSPDVVGVELAGALKNVVALAAGVSDGLQLGDNAKAALITRGLAEISRLGRSLGAQPLTFAGLAGLGDLVATCSSPLSRNHRLGERLAAGRTLTEAQAELGQVAEGVPTTRAAVELARAQGVDMPIAHEMHAVLFEGKDPRQGLLDLMQREPKAELG